MDTRHADEQDWSGKTVFSTGEAAQICNVSQQTIIRCFDSGRLQGFRVPGSKFRRIPREELIRFMRENDIPTGIVEAAATRVLCIYDEPSPLARLQNGLGGKARIEVRHATNPFDAGLLTERFRPNLILHDERMESLPLELVCGRVRQSEGERPRVVSVGPARGHADRARREEAGVDGVIELPKSGGDLAREVLALVQCISRGRSDA